MLNKGEEKIDKNKRKSENFNRSWIKIYKGNQNGPCKLGTCLLSDHLILWSSDLTRRTSEHTWLRRG